MERQWRIEHPVDWPEQELLALEQRMAAEQLARPAFIADPALSAGLRIRAGDTVVDGSSDGLFMTESEAVSFQEIADELGQARATPLKRLLTFNDSCFSGQWVNGSQGLGLTSSANTSRTTRQKLSKVEVDHHASRMTDHMYDGFATVTNNRNNKIEQYFVMSAASRSQTSQDWGSVEGGAFTYHLREAYSKLRGWPSVWTVADERWTTFSWSGCGAR